MRTDVMLMWLYLLKIGNDDYWPTVMTGGGSAMTFRKTTKAFSQDN